MDTETKKAIDSLLSGSRRYSKVRHEEKTVSFTAPRVPETLATQPTFCYNELERDLLNLKNEVATLSIDLASASIVFKAPLTATLISRIETAVPITQREWLADKRAWRFSPAVLTVLKPILKDEYKDILMLGVPKALPSTKFDQLMAKLTKDDRATIYSILAKKYHPDKGGSHEIMSLINIVFRG